MAEGHLFDESALDFIAGSEGLEEGIEKVPKDIRGFVLEDGGFGEHTVAYGIR